MNNKNLEQFVKKYEYSNDFKLATQLKSWIAINPTYGCIWDCSYCIQHKDKFYDISNYQKIQKVKNSFGEDITAEDVVTEIMTNSRITSKTPLTFYNFSDPFLPQNKKDLLKILTELDSGEFTNPVGLITRTFTDSETIQTIANLKYLKTIILVSYAGYENKNIESAPNSKRIELMQRFKDCGVPVLQYLRPLVEEWLEPNQIEKVRDNVAGKIDGVVMSGLRLTPEIIMKLIKKEVPIPKIINYENKFFPESLQKKVLKEYNGIAPVYRYTSCWVSATLNKPDFNTHMSEYINKNGGTNCPLPCKNGQDRICGAYSGIKDDDVRRLLSKIKKDNLTFTIKKNNTIHIDTSLNEIDKTFLRHNTLHYIELDKHEENHKDQIVLNMGGG